MRNVFMWGSLVFSCLINLSVIRAEDSVKLALNWKPEPEFGGFYEAAEMGAYKKAGLTVEILPGGSGQPVVQMVAAGQVEFGISSADEVLLARANGADVVALFAVYQNHPQGIMVHASSGITDLAGVFQAGLTLALQKGLAHATFLEKKYGFSKTKIVPYAGGIGSFIHDKKYAQQCFVTSEPIAAKNSGVEAKSFLIADAGYNPYAAVVVTRGDSLKKNEKRVEAFIRATREGWTSYLKDPKKTNQLMQKLNTSMDLKTFDESARIQIPLIQTPETSKSGLGSMTETRWKTLADQMTELKVLTKKIDISSVFKNVK